MKSKKAQAGWYWSILIIILVIISIVLIVGYYTGIFPKFTEHAKSVFFGPLD
ncbi:hypothetical protein GF374_02810 [Candidatus Woesearchaeota archaeon]|nr:hypothetical protein [Candidatus Woesearchaeota archaeon]